ncbi:MAG TPA: hypothetical protein HPP87_03975 [Planctomycetes bacterium]|nr:hypothetical protein [Planctomycetota bacterium]
MTGLISDKKMCETFLTLPKFRLYHLFRRHKYLIIYIELRFHPGAPGWNLILDTGSRPV